MVPTLETPPRHENGRCAAMALNPPQSVEHAAVWLAQAIQWAHERGATDVHLFPSSGEAMLWVRVDGELREVARYSPSIHQRMIARLKVMGRCSDYAGDLVQEGRFSLSGEAEAGEARLSVLPTLRGEKAVIRLMQGGGRLRGIDELGYSEELVAALRATLDRPQGLLLAVGPSGCGKSTALYALLADLAARAGHPLSIVTIEDPVEQSLPFAAQVGADPARGLGFAEGLRALLRQDPEVMMIGEIRDPQTASAALQAALTGHRLISSMHTLTAAEALVRLQQMSIPPYVISSALAGVLNLRLARLLCPHCKTVRPMTESELAAIPEAASWDRAEVAEAAGCEACLHSGHQGRTGLGEWLVPTAETATALQTHEASAAIAQTLNPVAPARPMALHLLHEQRISMAEWQRLGTLATQQATAI